MASPKGYRRSNKLIRLLHSMSRSSLSFCFFTSNTVRAKGSPFCLLVVILLNHVSKAALFFPFLSICHFPFRDAEIPHRRKPKFDNALAPRCSLRELLFFSFSVSGQRAKQWGKPRERWRRKKSWPIPWDFALEREVPVALYMVNYRKAGS